MDDTDENSDAAMMAAMGFGSFGTDKTNKKRKYNDESVTEADLQKQSHGTGANTSKLGRRPKKSSTEPAVSSSDGQATAAKGKGKAKAKDLAGGGLAAFLSHGHALPDKPAAVADQPALASEQPLTGSSELSIRSPAAQRPMTNASTGTPSLADFRRGVRNKHGDMAYFLPSFLEDPWAGLK